MTHEQSAIQAWSVLVLAARNQQILSYHTLELITGTKAFRVAPILGKVEEYCRTHKLPNLTALVVNQSEGVPGYLYPGYIGTIQHRDGPAVEREQDLEELGAQNKSSPDVFTKLFMEQSRVFVYDWLGTKVPVEEELKKSYQGGFVK